MPSAAPTTPRILDRYQLDGRVDPEQYASAWDAFAALLSREIPSRLRSGDFHIRHSTPQTTLVVSYNVYDPLGLPSSLIEALPYFDGRPISEALRAIAREKRLRLDKDLLMKLVDFSILVPVPS
jgi:hypothetical protein